MVHRAAKSIEGSTTVGITYQTFTGLLQNLATEVSIVRDTVNTIEEKGLLEIYIGVLQAYHDSLRLWMSRIQNSRNTYLYNLPPGWILLYSDPEHSRIIREYKLTTKSVSVREGSIKFAAVPEESIQMIWSEAQKGIGKATALLYGRK